MRIATCRSSGMASACVTLDRTRTSAIAPNRSATSTSDLRRSWTARAVTATNVATKNTWFTRKTESAHSPRTRSTTTPLQPRPSIPGDVGRAHRACQQGALGRPVSAARARGARAPSPVAPCSRCRGQRRRCHGCVNPADQDHAGRIWKVPRRAVQSMPSDSDDLVERLDGRVDSLQQGSKRTPHVVRISRQNGTLQGRRLRH